MEDEDFQAGLFCKSTSKNLVLLQIWRSERFWMQLSIKGLFSSSTSLIKISGDEEDERKIPQNEVFQ